MAGDKDSPSHTTTVTTTASNPAFRGKYIKTDSGWVETTEDIYEKINMTGNTVLSVPAMPALNHNVTLDEDEFKTKVLAIIAEYNRIVDTIVGFNCFVNYVPVKDIYDEDTLSSAFRQAVEARENSLVELQNQLQALRDTWAELKSHIVVDTPSFPLPTLITLMPDIQ